MAERIPYAEQAHLALKKRIMNNEFPAGAQYLEQELSQLLGMSRTPVREAMMRLNGEGLVDVRPRHGMQIRFVSITDMAEIYAVITSLEATAAALVAARKPAMADLILLSDAMAMMEEALENDNLGAWAEGDAAFHDGLVHLSGNKKLAQLRQTVLDQSHRIRLLTLHLRPKPTESNKDHAALINAILQGDVDAARDLHRGHRERSGKILIDLLRRHNLGRL